VAAHEADKLLTRWNPPRSELTTITRHTDDYGRHFQPCRT
jgi:hypothetical protein